MKEQLNLGFIGLGVMGEPMSINLARKSGQPLHVYDRASDAMARVVEQGGLASASAAEVAARADIVFLSLPSIDQVESVVDEILASPKRPGMIVDMSTSDVARTRALAGRLREAGIGFVDAPVARTKQAAVAGTLMISVGGSEGDVARLRPMLECMGSDVLHCGEIGSGQILKILNNMMVFMTVNALAEVLTIGRRSGMDGEKLFELLSQGSADSFVLRNHGMKSMAKDEFPEKTFPLTYAIKDASLALALADSAAFKPHIAQYAHDLMCQARDAGYAQNYHPVTVKLIDGRG
ncbi:MULTISPECIES: NAD(P)-dependent oxidoreductase [Achromobacter]|uniref:NAD(P)-dependent oxidoreductase n=1 Tax=Achromobacter spanius TaxID=217203 RepID=A0ABY8GXL2_9BURK|nr:MULTISPECIES: NAD(P)-dependent oxidoreductase [Achromobacter]WAI81508.1 NAD(P)-dependent oxidoreductase [Achromobacter spanius]WEX97025.1 NAD(P)-dependent oxidoreductase [Achromobacter sp. SS2-2022]WFP09258.1 NAD(P)-dependent oxidoreductase [Achromobacter spanius]